MCVIPEQFLQFNLDLHSFLYCDYKYFAWFAQVDNDNDEAERFRAILEWKGLIYYLQEAYFQTIWDYFNAGYVDGYRIVTRVFLKHLQEPTEYPIFDQNVWRAMRNLNHNMPENTPENANGADFEAHYMRIYVPFFEHRFQANENNIICPQIEGVAPGIVKRRMLDRALWEYGRILRVNNLAGNA